MYQVFVIISYQARWLKGLPLYNIVPFRATKASIRAHIRTRFESLSSRKIGKSSGQKGKPCSGGGERARENRHESSHICCRRPTDHFPFSIFRFSRLRYATRRWAQAHSTAIITTKRSEDSEEYRRRDAGSLMSPGEEEEGDGNKAVGEMGDEDNRGWSTFAGRMQQTRKEIEFPLASITGLLSTFLGD